MRAKFCSENLWLTGWRICITQFQNETSYLNYNTTSRCDLSIIANCNMELLLKRCIIWFFAYITVKSMHTLVKCTLITLCKIAYYPINMLYSYLKNDASQFEGYRHFQHVVHIAKVRFDLHTYESRLGTNEHTAVLISIRYNHLLIRYKLLINRFNHILNLLTIY